MNKHVRRAAFAIAAIVLVSAAPPSSIAQIKTKPDKNATKKEVFIYDAGRLSCLSWMEFREKRNNPDDIRFIQMREWLGGFLTSYNYYVEPTGNVGKATKQKELYAWLDGHCKENPTAAFIEAAHKLIEHLRTK